MLLSESRTSVLTPPLSAHSWTSTSTPRTCASTPSGPEDPGARASTPPTAPCASSTSPQVNLAAPPHPPTPRRSLWTDLPRPEGGVSAEPLPAAEPGNRHAPAEGAALPEHDGEGDRAEAQRTETAGETPTPPHTPPLCVLTCTYSPSHTRLYLPPTCQDNPAYIVHSTPVDSVYC